jgi:hypothetical protein
VERGHDRSTPGPLDLDRARVHQKERTGQQHKVAGECGQHQSGTLGERHRYRDPPAAPAVDHPAHRLHAGDRAGREDQQADAELPVAEREVLLDRRDAGGPGAQRGAEEQEEQRRRDPGPAERGAVLGRCHTAG